MAGPDSFDCSGFTFYCITELYDLPIKRTAYEQGYDDTFLKVENISDLKIGDLVFFNTVSDKDLCDHAGIYIGNNEFIHSSSANRKVIISNLKGTFYESSFSWGRRLIEDD